MVKDIIRQQRQLKGYTQKRLGELLGLNTESAQIMVARWEAGTRPVPRDKLKALSKLLEIPLEDLLS